MQIMQEGFLTHVLSSLRILEKMDFFLLGKRVSCLTRTLRRMKSGSIFSTSRLRLTCVIESMIPESILG